MCCVEVFVFFFSAWGIVFSALWCKTVLCFFAIPIFRSIICLFYVTNFDVLCILCGSEFSFCRKTFEVLTVFCVKKIAKVFFLILVKMHFVPISIQQLVFAMFCFAIQVHDLDLVVTFSKVKKNLQDHKRYYRFMMSLFKV